MVSAGVEQNEEDVLKCMEAAGLSAAKLQFIVELQPRYGSFWEKDVVQNSDAFLKDNFRIERSAFNILVGILPNLRKKESNFRLAIPLEKRIAISLYCLGSSADYRTIANLFGVSKAIVCRILMEFCREVTAVLAGEYLPAEFLTQEKITETVKGFEDMGFPQCFGEMDGCHIEVQPRCEDAVDYRNYKGWYSTVLFALVDYRYRFTYINVGCPGRAHDSKIFL
ncbi:uncharacterized protein LOC121403869 [Drosophila obscura]|uniref:uncharacterized protein LOC121403869 n=1 Tax=Drosophila obscura TaxID=7282 RepID=UPI001BB20490|nr:uncharacterized protein LOC121403869 [Drosophila obscura]